MVKHKEMLINISRFVIKNGIFLLVLATPFIFSSQTTDVYLLIKTVIIQCFVLVLAIFWLIKMNEEGSFKPVKTPLNLTILIFFGIAAFSLLRAYNIHEGLKDLGEILSYVVLFFVVANNVEEDDVKRLIGLMIICGTLVSLYDIWQNRGIDFTSPRDAHISTFGHPNFAAQYLLIVSPLTLSGLMAHKSAAKRSIYVFAFLVMLVFLLLTRTRGAWIALASSIFLMVGLIVLKRLKQKKKIITAKAGIIVLTICLILSASIFLLPTKIQKKWVAPIAERVASTFDLQNYSNATRLRVWENTFRMISDRPFFGVGIGNFKVVYPAYRSMAEYQATGSGIRYTKAHNEYLQIWSELGIIGFIVFIWILFNLFRICRQLWLQAWDDCLHWMTLGLIGSITATAVGAIFSSSLRVSTVAMSFWLVAGLTCVVYKKIAPEIR